MNKKSKADRGLYRRRGSPHWWIRYADRYGRIHCKSIGTTSKKLAREILAKQKVILQIVAVLIGLVLQTKNGVQQRAGGETTPTEAI